MKTALELSEYIDHVISSVQADYSHIYDASNVVMRDMPHKDMGRIAWLLAHMHKDIYGLINTLQKYQGALMKDTNASTTV